MLNHDYFDFAVRTLIQSDDYFDLTQETACTGFVIEGTQPSGADRKFIFKIDNNFYRFKADSLANFNHAVDFDNVLDYGNSAAELLALTDLSVLVGKKIYLITALYAPDDTKIPTATVGLKVSSFNNIYSKIDYSPEIPVAGKIISVAGNKILSGSATVNLRARLKTDDWSDWQDLSLCKNLPANVIQFSAQHTLTRLDGVDASKAEISAQAVEPDTFTGDTSTFTTKILTLPEKYFKAIDAPIFDDDIFVAAEDIQSIVNGSYIATYDPDPVTAENIDIVLRDGLQNFSGLKETTCIALVNHDRPATLKAYICYYAPPESAVVNLGAATGSLQNFNLSQEKIDPTTLQVQADGDNVIPFSFDSSQKLLRVQAPEGSQLVARFNYNQPAEVWQEMILHFGEDRQSCFIHQTATPQEKVAVKLVGDNISSLKIAFK